MREAWDECIFQGREDSNKSRRKAPRNQLRSLGSWACSFFIYLHIGTISDGAAITVSFPGLSLGFSFSVCICGEYECECADRKKGKRHETIAWVFYGVGEVKGRENVVGRSSRHRLGTPHWETGESRRGRLPLRRVSCVSSFALRSSRFSPSDIRKIRSRPLVCGRARASRGIKRNEMNDPACLPACLPCLLSLPRSISGVFRSQLSDTYARSPPRRIHSTSSTIMPLAACLPCVVML